MDRGASQRAKLDAEDFGTRQRQPDAAKPEEGICLAFGRQPTDRLVAADIKSTDGDRLALSPFEKTPVGLVLRFLLGQRRAVAEQELGAHQADAVAHLDIDPRKLVEAGDIDHDLDPRSVGGDRRSAEI